MRQKNFLSVIRTIIDGLSRMSLIEWIVVITIIAIIIAIAFPIKSKCFDQPRVKQIYCT
jgi:Tfp pilus assembly protein FimT